MNEEASVDADLKNEEHRMALAIGRQVRSYRNQLNMTINEVANLSHISIGMLSKIERGNVLPSINVLVAIARALNAPLTSLLRKYEEQRDCSYVEAGNGLVIERYSTSAGHEYRLLGHNIGGQIKVEPFLVTLSDEMEVFPLFQYRGVTFMHILKGRMIYRYGKESFDMKPGDSLFFDAEGAHGPDKLLDVPLQMLAVRTRLATFDEGVGDNERA